MNENNGLAMLRFRIFHTKGIYSDAFHHLIFIGSVIVGGSLRNAVHHVHALYHLSERRIGAVQMGRLLVHDEKLASRGVGVHGTRHGKYAFRMLQFIFHTVLGELALDIVARTAHARALGTAALNHEALDDAVKDQAVIEPLVDQADEIVDGDRGDLGVKLRLDDAAVFHINSNNRILCHKLFLSVSKI